MMLYLRLAILFYLLTVVALAVSVVGVLAGLPFLGAQSAVMGIALAVVGTLFLVGHFKRRGPTD
jgi:hypothetical protein